MRNIIHNKTSKKSPFKNTVINSSCMYKYGRDTLYFIGTEYIVNTYKLIDSLSCSFIYQILLMFIDIGENIKMIFSTLTLMLLR